MKRSFAAHSKSSSFVEVCFVPTLDTMVEVYKETIGFGFNPSLLGDCVASPRSWFDEAHHERGGCTKSKYLAVRPELVEGRRLIATQSVAGEGKDEGAVHLAASPRFSSVEGDAEPSPLAKAGVSWPVSLSLITNQASIG